MPRYNLLDEKWIQVASKDNVEKVSIKELLPVQLSTKN